MNELITNGTDLSPEQVAALMAEAYAADPTATPVVDPETVEGVETFVQPEATIH
jgi:hypothetical protein